MRTLASAEQNVFTVRRPKPHGPNVADCDDLFSNARAQGRKPIHA